MYKVLYICYLTRKGVQKQKAFITKSTKNSRVECTPGGINKEIHELLVEVCFFKTKEDALKDARTYCHPDDIFMDGGRKSQLPSIHPIT